MHDYANRRIQEIVARTVIARGRRHIQQRCVLHPAEPPEQLLGVTCVPGATRATRQHGDVFVSGNFEIHIWYAHSGSQQTTVLKQTFTYDDTVPVKALVGEPVGEPQVDVILTQNPAVVACQLGVDGLFHVDVSLEVQAELTGDARLRVQVFLPPDFEIADEDLAEVTGGDFSEAADADFTGTTDEDFGEPDDDLDFDPASLPNGRVDSAAAVPVDFD